MGVSSAGMVGALPAPLSDVSEAHRDVLRAKGSQKSDHGEEAVPEDSLRLARRPVTRIRPLPTFLLSTSQWPAKLLCLACFSAGKQEEGRLERGRSQACKEAGEAPSGSNRP